MPKDMRGVNRPNPNTGNGLTGNGGHPRGAAPGSAPEGNAPAPPRASSPALRRLFASLPPGAARAADVELGGLAADVEELVELFAPLTPDAGVPAGQAAVTALGAGLGTQAAIRSGTGAAVSGPDVELDVHPIAGVGGRVGPRVEVLVTADRARAFTPPPGGPAAGG